MRYHLLTGATGLLGCYLLRDAYRLGIRLAVVARSSGGLSARTRIDAVMTRWERQAGYCLPRPVVIEGDLGSPRLGLGDREVRWIAQNCESVIHNAASLTFSSDERTGEPWRSNVQGTENVLDACRQAKIKSFFHVSTAYVCGLRQDTVAESDVDVGQVPGNDYEKSKLEAEKLVRAASFLENPTVFRPGIIVGDSQTGYTSTFHGFYVPLRVVHSLLGSFDNTQLEMSSLLKLLGLEGSERKNFAPVDWVSAVISRVIADRSLHGRTYHLTPRNPTPVLDMGEVMSKIVGETMAKLPTGVEKRFDDDYLQGVFREQMDVYRAYWRDDPKFDQTNTAKAAPQFPCPEVDRDLMRRLCKFALDTNFGWPRPKVLQPELDVEQQLRQSLAEASERGDPGGALVGLQVNGQGGGQWALRVKGNDVESFAPGVSPDCSAVYYMNTHTLSALIRRQLTVDHSIRTGRVLIEGNGFTTSQFQHLLGGLVNRVALAEGSAASLPVHES